MWVALIGRLIKQSIISRGSCDKRAEHEGVGFRADLPGVDSTIAGDDHTDPAEDHGLVVPGNIPRIDCCPPARGHIGDIGCGKDRT